MRSKYPNSAGKYRIDVRFNCKLIRRFFADTLSEAFREADGELESRDNVTHYEITYPNGNTYVRELYFPCAT